MLTKCPECVLQVSDKAPICPHCGYPLKENTKYKPPTTHKKGRRRLPNGFGQISELPNRNLRKPFRAMTTVGKNEVGRPICKILGYYETYNDAYTALVDFNRNPYDLDMAMTVQELYEKWLPIYQQKLKDPKSANLMKASWAFCKNIYGMKVTDIRPRHIKGCMDEAPSPVSKSRVKSLFNIMLDYALEFGVVEKNYARDFKISELTIQIKENEQHHLAFTSVEMKALWDNLDMDYVDTVLIQCYMGWRPQELGLIRLENVDLENGYIMGGMKTENGINRIVPIHTLIYDLVKDNYDHAKEIGSDFLLNCEDMGERNGVKLTYERYATKFSNIMSVLKCNKDHKPHDPRKQFVTMCKRYKVEEYAIKRMIGHAINDITESTYTDRDRSWLKEEVEKITNSYMYE